MVTALEAGTVRGAAAATVRHGVRAATADRVPVIAIVGRPNVGKSTFFGHASGRYAETANVPGTTVEVARRRVHVGRATADLVDLPGALALTDSSAGLAPFWTLLTDLRPDAIVVVADAGDLARHLPLALACRDLGVPIVVAANLDDEAAARGVAIDHGRLSQLLAAPVHRTVGRRGVGVGAAVRDALRLSHRERQARPATPYSAALVRRVTQLATSGGAELAMHPQLAAALDGGRLTPLAAATIAMHEALDEERWAISERWAADVETRADVAARFADRLARWVTRPWPGIPIFAAVTVASLGATMAIGGLLAAILDAAWTATVSPVLVALIDTVVPVAELGRALLWALDSGLLAMLAVGIPFVLTFYLILAALEDSGYLAAAAVLTDRAMNAFGLSGRAAIPVLAATGCNVPAIYGTRVLGSRRERLLASFLIVLTPCSARSAVVIAAIAPFAGPPVALAAFGVVALIAIAAGVAANAVLPGRQAALVLELPALRAPIARQVVTKAWNRFRSFLVTATPVMLAGSFALGLAYESGAIEPVEAVIGPAVGWLLGLPAVAGIALILAFLRKELALQLLVVLAVAEFGAGASSLAVFMSPGQLFVYAVVTAVSIPCAATLATLADEFGWRSSVAVSAAALGVALVAGAIVARAVGVA